MGSLPASVRVLIVFGALIAFGLVSVLHAARGAAGSGIGTGDEKTPKTGAKMALPPVEVRSVVQGAYEIHRAGGQVGREDFVRTTLSNNTVIYESVFEAMEAGETAVSGNNKLEVEEDTGFPRSYHSYRRTRGTHSEAAMEVSIAMFANVAAISERRENQEETRRVVLPAGCLFVEGNIVHHLHLVLEQYDRRAGGNQAFRAFDPLGRGLTDVSLEFAGEIIGADSIRAEGPGTAEAPVSRFKYFTGGSFAADVFADANGNITRVEASPADLVYILVSMANRTGGASPSN
jgi:hypothetical protein